MNQSRAIVPLAIQVLTVCAVIFIPWTALALELDFRVNLKERQEVVKLIEQDKLRSNDSHNSQLIKLPDSLASVSKGGGEIMVEEEGNVIKVFFFTFRGIMDNFSGFIFRSDGSPPTKSDFEGDYKEVKKMADNWYFVSSY